MESETDVRKATINNLHKQIKEALTLPDTVFVPFTGQMQFAYVVCQELDFYPRNDLNGKTFVYRSVRSRDIAQACNRKDPGAKYVAMRTSEWKQKRIKILTNAITALQR